MTIDFLSESPTETAGVGRRLASRLQTGDIILLEGALGAGKTAFVRGVVAGLDPDVAALVSSQSYVVAGEYPTHPRVVHLDLYRLESQEDVLALGYEELLYGEDRIVLVEWPGLLEPLLEPDDPLLRIELFHDEAGQPERRRLRGSSPETRLEDALRWALSGDHDSQGRDS